MPCLSLPLLHPLPTLALAERWPVVNLSSARRCCNLSAALINLKHKGWD